MSQVTGRTRFLPPFFMIGMARDPLGFLSGLHERHGSFVSVRAGRHVYPLIEPELIREVLVTQASSFAKGRGLEMARRLLGNGLLTANGEEHLRQRRLVQPAFHRQRLQRYAEVMGDVTAARLSRWRDGQCLCLSREMMATTLEIITQTMFGESIGTRAEVVEEAMNEALERFQVGLLPLLPLLELLPLPSNRRFQSAREQLDGVILDLIRTRRQNPEDRGDLLSMLLAAVDEGQQMSDQQLRDEAMTIFLAGHETTANALAWTFALLAQHPQEMVRVQAEVDQVLNGRLPGFADLERLPACRRALQESMRLHPPAWIIGRQATEKVQIGGEWLEPGSVVLMTTWAAHRHGRFFPQPERFWPARWADSEWEKSLPKFAYFPFGGGNRVCIGEHFARMEALLILASVVQSWDFRLLAGQMPSPEPRITLRLKGGLPVQLWRRRGLAQAV
ncbi:cytochrome P450 [bacterium]|nr:cytochrome P450 [bacterium]